MRKTTSKLSFKRALKAKKLAQRSPAKQFVRSDNRVKNTIKNKAKAKNVSTDTITTVRKFPIVGIGESAGGLEAITKLLKRLPAKINAAFVVVQHHNPKHQSMLVEILSRITTIPVVDAIDGVKVEPNTIYIRPSNVYLSLANGILWHAPVNNGQYALPIDYFFQTLADDRDTQSIGIILSGTATDGTQGLLAIKAAGGLTFVQEPKSAKYDGMPKNAIASGAADFILTPEAIADELVRLAEYSYLGVVPMFAKSDIATVVTGESETRIVEARTAKTLDVQHDEQILSKIFKILRGSTQADFSQYKSKSVLRRLARRLLVLKIDNLADYAAYLEQHPEEVKTLFAELLIHVTKLFRDPEAFEFFKKYILPMRLKNWNTNMPFRIWVPGCATGEEVYSIAISCLEYMDEQAVHIPLQIFASDISMGAIRKARMGIFTDVNGDISTERIKRFFEKIDGGYRISKRVRELCIFSKHNIATDPPFAKVDLISCRNVFIYFDSELQKRIFPVFHYALNPDGILWLGQSESVGVFTNLFNLADKTYKFYIKKNVTVPSHLPYSTLRYSPENFIINPQPSVATRSRLDLQKESDRLSLLEYVPPGVVINEAMDILQIRGRTSPFLELATGQASLNLMKMARPELIAEIRAAIKAARKQNTIVKKESLQIYTSDGPLRFNLKVVPIHLSADTTEYYFSIFFEEIKITKLPFKSITKKKKTSQQEVTELKKQLSTSHEYQKSLIEDLETAKEDLTTYNEELQSTNEELQSTIEELETAKEELQSTNEELTTVNDELNLRNVEMLNLTNDLVSLLENIEIPIVMLGADTKIRRFTPGAGKTLKLIGSDIGRSIGDIKPDLGILNLEELVTDVIKHKTIKEVETQDKQGYWYHLQVRPYRTAEQKIDGALIVLLDVDKLKRNEDQLKRANNDAMSIIEAQHIPLLVIDSAQRVRLANDNFYKKFQVKREETEGRLVSELGNGQWNIPQLLKLIEATLLQNLSFEEFEVATEFPQIGRKIMLINSKQIHLAGTGENVGILTIVDVTARVIAEAALKESEEKYRKFLSCSFDALVVIDRKGQISFVNQTLEKIFGYEAGELLNQNFKTLIISKKEQAQLGYYEQYMLKPEPRIMGKELNLLGIRKDGTEFPIEISMNPVQTNSETYVTCLIRDLTEIIKFEEARKQILAQEKALRAEAENANRIKDEFLATLSHELRTPLTTILGWAQVLLEKQLPTELQEGLTVIERSARVQGQLINDLLDVSRIRAGKLALNFETVDLVKAIKLAVDSVQNLASQKSIHITMTFSVHSCNISADYCRLQQVFWNLLTNAIKFTPNGGRISVELNIVETKLGKQAYVKISDTGIGIKQEHIANIFERFSQIDSSMARTHGGLGLGLSIVRSLVELQHGTVSAESKGVGQGAIFTVSLPLTLTKNHHISQLPKPAEQQNKSTRLDGKKILIVDDSADNRLLFSVVLKSLGAQVRLAESVAEAFPILAEFKPDVLLSDISMPGEDGYSFIHKLRQSEVGQITHLPVIAITAYAGAEDARRILNAGFSAHIAKPVLWPELTKIIAELT